MNKGIRRIISIIVVFLSVIGFSKGSYSETAGDRFTGEILTLLYVTDVRKSVEFYKALGFEHDYFYDYLEDVYSREWTNDYPPQYAEMIQGKIRIGLTTADETEQVYGGGVRHYFMVTDVDRHYSMVTANGIVSDPDALEERPWMSFFTVSDPDNHQIVFGTKNQAYYDRARDQLNSLDR